MSDETRTFTPGPWAAYTGDDQPQTLYTGLICAIFDAPDGRISVCGNRRSSRSEDEANAYLIASAPDLLAALEALALTFRGGWGAPCWCLGNLDGGHQERCLQARAAIAKASGQPAPLTAGADGGG